MGLFTTKCGACNERVRKGLKFCPHCGVGTDAKIPCPSCGTAVKRGVKFCFSCGAEVAGGSSLAANRWARQPGDFAVRIDASSVPANTWWRDRQLTVEHGTRAMIFQAGQYRGEVAEGRYDMGGFTQRLNHFLVDQGMVAILLDAGDLSLDLENGGLRTVDGFDVQTRARLVLRAVEPDAFFVNMMKGRARIRVSDPEGKDDLENELAGEVQMALSAMVARHRAEELFDSLPLRNELETQLRDAISVTLSRLGLALVQLRFIGFEGEEYAKFAKRRSNLLVSEAQGHVELEETRQQTRFRQTGEREKLTADQGDADLQADRLKLAARLRTVLSQDRLDSFQSESDFEQFVRKTEHELGLKNTVLDNEMQSLQEKFRADRDREGLLRRIEIEGITDDVRKEREWKQLITSERVRDETQSRELRRKLEATDNQAERRKIELEQERLEHAEAMRRQDAESDFSQKRAQAGVEALRQMKQMEADEDRLAQELEEKKLASRSQASVMALMSVIDGPVAEQLAALEKMRLQQSLSPEQLLAIAAQTSPEAAKALSQRFAAEGTISAQRAEIFERQLSDQRTTADKAADRLERMMQTALSQMGQVAATRAQAQPFVINPSTAAARCRECGDALTPGKTFCAHCGKRND